MTSECEEVLVDMMAGSVAVALKSMMNVSLSVLLETVNMIVMFQNDNLM